MQSYDNCNIRLVEILQLTFTSIIQRSRTSAMPVTLTHTEATLLISIILKQWFLAISWVTLDRVGQSKSCVTTNRRYHPRLSTHVHV